MSRDEYSKRHWFLVWHVDFALCINFMRALGSFQTTASFFYLLLQLPISLSTRMSTPCYEWTTVPRIINHTRERCFKLWTTLQPWYTFPPIRVRNDNRSRVKCGRQQVKEPRTTKVTYVIKLLSVWIANMLLLYQRQVLMMQHLDPPAQPVRRMQLNRADIHSRWHQAQFVEDN